MDSHPYTWQVSDQHYLNIHELTFQMSESNANIFATIHTDANLGGTLSRVVLWQKQLFLRNYWIEAS